MSSNFEHKGDYEPLPAYEGEEISRVKRSQPERTHIIHWLGQLLLFTISLVLFICGLEGRVARSSEAPHAVYSPATEAIEYTTGFFSQGWLDDNVFKGTPRPELDRAWDSISKGDIYPGPTLSISEQDLKSIGRGSSQDVAARLPSQHGGGYLASMEVFHHLHCLNMARKMTYKEHYPEMSEPWLRNHIDHCIEMVRQRLMCTADVGIITGVWVDHYGEPYPDFRTQHQCRNFDKIHQWAKDHEIRVSMEDIKGARGSHNLTQPPVVDVDR